PLAGLWSQVTLAAGKDGGTHLTHEVWTQPRGVLGRLVSFLEVRLKARKLIERAYRRMDEVARKDAQAELAGAAHPLAAPARLAPSAEALLGKGLAAACEGRAPLARLAPKLESELRDALDGDAARMRPYALARRWRAGRSD